MRLFVRLRSYAFALVLLAGTYVVTLARPAAGDFFTTGQAADRLLSGYGFDRTGGPLRFNHPGGIVVAGGRLILADRNNNRVLVWKGVPVSADEPPEFALGQTSLWTNAAGDRLDQLNWPTAVATDGVRLLVADTYNDRVLVWRTPPSRAAQPADYAIATDVRWPWGLWTDGRRLAVSNTGDGRVLMWDRIPEADSAPDLRVKIAEFGTPRAVASDGVRFAVSDHNAKVGGRNAPGNFFWTAFPASAQPPYSFFMSAPATQVPAPPPGAGAAVSEHFHHMAFADDGRFLALGNRSLCIWGAFPSSATTPCATSVGGAPGSAGFALDAGDNSGFTVTGGRLFVSLNNGNRVVVFNSIPRSASELPAFAIGSPSISTNTLTTDAIVTNPVPLTDGARLWVTSDFDRRLHVWNALPSSDGQKPDASYALSFAPWASARVGAGLVLAGHDTVAIWNQPPGGAVADTVFTRKIGSVVLNDLRGVAWDGTYFYLASASAGRVWVWRGVPAATSEPVVTLAVEQPGRISSDGRFLAVPSLVGGAAVLIYDVATLTSSSSPKRIGSSAADGAGAVRLNLPGHALVQNGALFIADTPNNRVLAWRDAAAAASGALPDAVLGAPSLEPVKPAVSRTRLFWPGALAWDGARLWVGEFKFSNRIVRFSQEP